MIRLVPCLALFVTALPAQVVISQFYGAGGNSGATYQNDYVELFNSSNASQSLNGWSLQYAAAGGSSWSRVALNNVLLLPGQYYLVQLAGGANGVVLPTTADQTSSTINMSGTAGKIVLMKMNTTITTGTNCPTVDVADFAPYGSTNCTSVITALSITTAAARASNGCGTTFSTVTLPLVSGGLRNASSLPFNVCGGPAPLQIFGSTPNATVGTPYTASLVASGGTGSYSWSISSPLGLGVSPNSGANTTVTGIPSGQGTAVVQLSDGSTSVTRNITINAAFSCVPTHTIMQIQGSGAVSPLANNTAVTVRGIVTGLISNGFFLQDATGDGNPATSDGIFVFTSTAPTVLRGADACVTGNTLEFVSSSDNAATVTELVAPLTINTISTGNPMPAAVTLTVAEPSSAGVFDQLERYEGMRVTIPTAAVISPADGFVTESSATSSLNGEIYVSVQGAPRPYKVQPGIDQPANVVATQPAVINIPVTVPRPEGNPQRIFVDFNRQTGGPAPLDVNVGQGVTGLVGPLHYLNRTYALLPDPGSTPAVTGSAPSAPAITAPTANQITIASFNMERLFPAGTNGVTTTAYQNRLNKLSLAIRNTLQSPDVIGVQEANGTALVDLAAKLNTDAPGNNWVGVLAPVTNDAGGIAVGFLYKGSRISNVTFQQFGTTHTYVDPSDNSTRLLNDRPPYLLSATAAINGSTVPFRFSVLVNHLRSNLGLDQPNLDNVSDLVSEGVRVRKKRLGQALFTASTIQQLQAANPALALVVLGDFNAFDISDGWADVTGTIKGTPAAPAQVVFSGPITDIVPALGNTVPTPALNNLMDLLTASEKYTYIFRGNSQAIDHILVNPNAQSRYQAIQVGRGNADFSESFRNDSARPERITDHDQPVATFNLPTNPVHAATITRAVVSFNRATGQFQQNITVRNDTASPIANPIVLLNNFAAGWSWLNSDGVLAGTAFKRLSGPIQPGASATVQLIFTRVGTAALTYNAIASNE